MPDTTPDVTNTGYFIYKKPNGDGGGKSIFQPIGFDARASRYYTIVVYMYHSVSGGNKSCIGESQIVYIYGV